MPFLGPESAVPSGLRTESLLLRPITVDDAERDFAAVMDSRESLRLWRQSPWPEDDFSLESNRDDMIELEERHGARRAFTYTVLDPSGSKCVGCVYIYSTRATFLARSRVEALGDADWADVDAVVFFWVRRAEVQLGVDGILLSTLRDWFRTEWGFGTTTFATSEPFRQQVELLDRTDLRLRFRLFEPDKPQPRLIYG